MDIDTGLALIKSSGLLNGEGDTLAKLSDEMRQTHTTVQVLRTRTEMEVSVLSDVRHPTPDAKYWQAVREQDVQYTNLVMLSFDHQEKQIERERLERDLASETDELEARSLNVALERTDFTLGLQRREAFHRLREISEWSDIKKQLAPACKHTLDDVNAHQFESLSQRFYRQEQIIAGTETAAADRINIVGLAETARRIEST